MHAVTVMALAVALALSVIIGAIVWTNLNLASFTGPRGIARTHTVDADSVAGTVSVRIPTNTENYIHTRKVGCANL